MYCKHCGKEVEEGISFCPYCGGALNEAKKEPLIKQESIDKAKETADETAKKAKEALSKVDWKEPSFLEKILPKHLMLAGVISSIVALIIGAIFTILALVDWTDIVDDMSVKQFNAITDLSSVAHVLLVIAIIVNILVMVITLWKYLSDKNKNALFLAGSSLASVIVLPLQNRYFDWIDELIETVNSLLYSTSYSSGSFFGDLYNLFSTYGNAYATAERLEATMPSALAAILLVIVSIVTMVAASRYGSTRVDYRINTEEE